MIISVLLLSTILLSMTLVGVSSVIRQLQGSTVEISKEIASRYATACAEVAMERLGRFPSYAGDEVVAVGTGTCTIRPITWGWTIETWALVNNEYARYRIVLSSRAPITISSWEEVSSF